MRRFLLWQVRRHVGPDFHGPLHAELHAVGRAVCAVPNADLFKALASGGASIVTDQIDTFTEKGILLKSGREIEADIIITATGLNLQMLGGMELSVDGEARD